MFLAQCPKLAKCSINTFYWIFTVIGCHFQIFVGLSEKEKVMASRGKVTVGRKLEQRGILAPHMRGHSN